MTKSHNSSDRRFCKEIESLLQYIINEGSGKKTPLHIAIQRKFDKDFIALVITKFVANVNAKDSSGETPLHEAVKVPDYTEVVDLLLEQGSDVNAEDNFDITPLHVVAEGTNNAKVVRLLLEKGDNPNAKDTSGSTPLHMFVKHEIHVSIKLLL